MTSPRAAISFVRFCEEILKLELSPAWKVLLAISVDRVDPSTLEGKDRELAILLFGRELGAIPAVAYRTLVWRLGRGSGKTTIAAALGIWRAVTADLSSVGPGMIAASVIVAPTLRTAKIALRVARELVRQSPLEKYVAKNLDSTEAFEIKRPDGRSVSFVTVSASRGGHTLRGFDIVSLVLDESEFFSSAPEAASVDVHVSDRDLVAAASARLHGSMILISTPWPVETLTSELVDRCFAAPRDALVAIGFSVTMRPDDPDLVERIAIERARDPDNARREFDCDASATGSGAFFDPVDVLACVADEAPVWTPGAPCTGAMDLGFVKDASALAILERSSTRLALVHLDQVKPTKGSPIVPSLLIDRFGPALRAHGVRHVFGDSFNAEPIREHLKRHGVRLVVSPDTATTKAERYLALRAAFVERRIIIPNDARLLSALRSIVAKALPGGSLSITAPRRAGTGHADTCSALVLALYASRRGGLSYGVPTAPVSFTRNVRPSPDMWPSGKSQAMSPSHFMSEYTRLNSGK